PLRSEDEIDIARKLRESLVDLGDIVGFLVIQNYLECKQ
ncbi:hypothetical protein A2U01_0084880, partial [Trifolium medium]|nr:hypothetical protein [Trifolium medium]